VIDCAASIESSTHPDVSRTDLHLVRDALFHRLGGDTNAIPVRLRVVMAQLAPCARSHVLPMAAYVQE
jgi:hypothetical protein